MRAELGTRSDLTGVVAPHAVRVTRRVFARLQASRWELALGLLLAFTLVSRLALRPTVPYNWDAVDYILALRDFDLARDQPHPPGNPLYVLAGRAMNQLIADPNQALVALSILASLVAVWATARLGTLLAGRGIGLFAAALLAVNPIFWLHGDVALTYAPEAAVALLVALAAWRGITVPDWRSAAILGVTFAVAGGFRPTLLPLLGPLYLFGLARLSWRRRLATVMITAIICLAWLVPLVSLSGGLAAYRELLARQAEMPASNTSIIDGSFSGWLQNLAQLSTSLAVSINVLALMVLAALIRRRPQPDWRSGRAVLLWLWVVPPLATFVFVHFGQMGYVLLILPPLFLLALIQIEHAWPRSAGHARLFVVALAVLGSLLLVFPMVSFVQDDSASWSSIQQTISVLPPADTVILTRVSEDGSFRVAGYLFPAYRVLGVDGDGTTWGVKFVARAGRSTVRLDAPFTTCRQMAIPGVRHVVVLDERLAARVADPGSWSRTLLPNGIPLLHRELPSGTNVLDFAGNQIRVEAGSAVNVGPGCGA